MISNIWLAVVLCAVVWLLVVGTAVFVMLLRSVVDMDIVREQARDDCDAMPAGELP